MELVQFLEEGVDCLVGNMKRLVGGLPRPVDYMVVYMIDVECQKKDLSDWTEWRPGLFSNQIIGNFYFLQPKFVSSFDGGPLFEWAGLQFPS